ncbi:MAG: hypothetical protein CRN43_02945 [Candidatus Nephrothrix sp. EaCA]|nr:MAG: hypothetical protein CRN43_02945 [Candidatus Nephrothrix sp. EaCA]
MKKNPLAYADGVPHGCYSIHPLSFVIHYFYHKTIYAGRLLRGLKLPKRLMRAPFFAIPQCIVKNAF